MRLWNAATTLLVQDSTIKTRRVESMVARSTRLPEELPCAFAIEDNSLKNITQGAAARTLSEEIRKCMSRTDRLLQVDIAGGFHVPRVNTEDLEMASGVRDIEVDLIARFIGQRALT